MPARMASAPNSGPTVRSSTMVSGAGRAPARSSTERSLAVRTVKEPLICPWPPVMGSRITGALITLSSSTMAKGRPTLARVISAKRLVPVPSKVKFTTHSPVRESCPARALVRFLPSTATLRRTATRSPARSLGRNITPGGGLPARLALSSTRWNVMRAVRPSKSLIRFGSSTPGSVTRMRD